MIYLTQVILDYATASRLRLCDNYDWHQALWKAFPGREGENRDFLIRIDQRQDSFRLLIVSPVKPTRPDWCPQEGWQGTKEIGDEYFSHKNYRFQLCANPTKKVSVQNDDGTFKKNGRRLPLSKREDLVAWLRRKGEEGGFFVDLGELKTVPLGREYFDKKGVTGLHSAVEFQGVLSVTDKQKFRETFERGIGSAKAFGFGLLIIIPV